MPGFVEIARDAFAFLESDYRFSIAESSDERGVGWITYVNLQNGVAVKVLYEFTTAFVFVFIYRFIDGQLRDNVLPVTDNSEISCFDFNDALAVDQKMKPAYEYGEQSKYDDPHTGLQSYVEEFAARLRQYGGRLLEGDFAMLAQVAPIIKRRARELL